MKRFFFCLAALFGSAVILFGCGQQQEELHVFIWGNYIKPELIQKFEKECHCKVVVDTYDSNESMYAKLKLGATGYDLIFPSNYIFDIMQKQGMLEALDFQEIPNRKNVDEEYYKHIGVLSGDYGIPFMVSNTGIAYRKDKVQGFEPTWSMFSRQDLKGRMTMLNDIREAMGAALRFLGYSLNSKDEKEIGEAADLLISWKMNLAKFESEQYKNGIASAEYLVVQGYSGDILQVMQENPEVSFVYPEQGIDISLDYMAIPKGAPNPKIAHAFMNFLLDADVAAENIAFTYYLSPNKAAYGRLAPNLRNNEILFPSKSLLEKSEVIENIGEAIELYNKAWDRVKAAN